jgi:hypothetical protein
MCETNDRTTTDIIRHAGRCVAAAHDDLPDRLRSSRILNRDPKARCSRDKSSSARASKAAHSVGDHDDGAAGFSQSMLVLKSVHAASSALVAPIPYTAARPTQKGYPSRRVASRNWQHSPQA